MTPNTRERLSFEETGKGTVAVLTVELGDQIYTYRSSPYEDSDLDRLAGSLATLEADGIEGFFGDVWKGIKKGVKGVAKVAKKIAASDVFRAAAKGLALAAPALGPFAPAAMGVAAAAGVASKLASADVSAKAGAKKAAARLVKAAQSDATKISRGDPVAAQKLLQAANAKRKNADAVVMADKTPARASPSTRLRSNRPGNVTSRDLALAKAQGRIKATSPRIELAERVFWVA